MQDQVNNQEAQAPVMYDFKFDVGALQIILMGLNKLPREVSDGLFNTILATAQQQDVNRSAELAAKEAEAKKAVAAKNPVKAEKPAAPAKSDAPAQAPASPAPAKRKK